RVPRSRTPQENAAIRFVEYMLGLAAVLILHCRPNREQSVSSITPPAGGDSSAVPSPRPTSDPARLESPADARRACPSASRNRSRCAAGDSCIGPHTVESGDLHLPATAAFSVNFKARRGGFGRGCYEACYKVYFPRCNFFYFFRTAFCLAFATHVPSLSP